MGEVLVWRVGREEALWRKENEVGHQGFSVFRSSKNASQQESKTGHYSMNLNCS